MGEAMRDVAIQIDAAAGQVVISGVVDWRVVNDNPFLQHAQSGTVRITLPIAGGPFDPGFNPPSLAPGGSSRLSGAAEVSVVDPTTGRLETQGGLELALFRVIDQQRGDVSGLVVEGFFRLFPTLNSGDGDKRFTAFLGFDETFRSLDSTVVELQVRTPNRALLDFTTDFLVGEADYPPVLVTAIPTPSDDRLLGSDGGDALDGLAGDDVVDGAAGDDRLSGGDGADTLLGGAGDDTLDGGPGQDVIDGGAGVDVVTYAAASAAVGARLDGEAGFAAAAGDRIENVEILLGSRFSDALVGSGRSDTLDGGAGDDRLFGLEGDDVLIGGDGADFVDGGGGFDTASYASAPAGVGARLDGVAGFGAAAGDVYRAVEALAGSAFADVLVGSSGANRIVGGAGADRLFGFGGHDTLLGGVGGDIIDGGSGIDVVSYVDATAAVGARLDGVASFGAAAGDRYRAVEVIVGSRFDDALVSGGGGNRLEGGDGADRLFGFGGRDWLSGDAGADRLFGGEGGDLLHGGPGNDELTGGLGADLFHFDGPGFGDDVIRGFEDGVDRLDFRDYEGLRFDALAISGGGAVTRIDIGQDTVFVLGPAFGQVDAADMLFGV
jgi:Ca2+-binding RTX toxin-like protein